MADETSTANSEQTTTETAATETATDQTAASTTETQAAASDDLGTTALGSGTDEAAATTDDTTSADDKPVVPEAYELTVPEGFEQLDPGALAAATPVFKELGLTNEQADKLMPVAGAFAQKLIAERDQQFLGQILEQRKSWLEEAKADKEIGGANWDGTMRDAARFLDTMGAVKGSPLRNALDESGFGNHPELIRVLAKGGKAIGEDSDFVRGDVNAAVKPKSDAELFYPTSKE